MNLPLAPWAIGAQSTDEKVQVIAADGEHICYVERDPAFDIAIFITTAPKMLGICERLAALGQYEYDSRIALAARAIILEAKGGTS